jgi:hypothetical protein
MSVVYLHTRVTKSSLTSLVSSSGLNVGQLYYVTDEARVVIATATNAYSEHAKKSEVALLAGAAFTGAISAPNFMTNMSAFCSGLPTASEVVAGAIFPVATTITQANCVAKATVAATSSTVFTIAKDGTTVGTITFASSGTTGTISITSGSITALQNVTITAPGTADATLANISFLVRA